MAKDNPKKNPRSIFSTANKYQDSIILLTFFPSTLIFCSFIIIVFIGNPMISKAVFHISSPGIVSMINRFSGLIVLFICSIFLVSLIIAFIISHNMVGAFGRIIRELDDILEGKSHRTITCRPNDDLTKDLLKRINVLVKFYVDHQQGKKGH